MQITSRLFKTRLKMDRDPLARPDIRTLLVMLLLSFLAIGDARLKSDILETKGLFSGLFKGLAEDPTIVINHVLVSLHRDVVADRSIGLEVRRSVFDETAVTELVKLYDVPVVEGEEEGSPNQSVDRFLYALSEWLSQQVNESQARSFGPQKVLGTVLRTLKVTEDAQQRELGLHILQKAPILAGQFWARFPSSLDPRLSSRWISAITFATQVVSLPVSPHLLVQADAGQAQSAPPTLVSVLDNILPPTLNQVWLSKALRHENALVSFLSSLFLLAALQKATRVLEAIATSSDRLEEHVEQGRWAGLGLRVREHLRTVLPDPQIVVFLMQKTAVAAPAVPGGKDKKGKAIEKKEEPVQTEAEVEHHLRTNVALRLLWLYHRTTPALIAGLRFDFAKLPQAHVTPTDAEGVRAISSAYALRLAAIHSASLSWSKPGEHFKSTLLPLFQLYRAPATPGNRQLLLTILGRLLNTSTLFGEGNAEEVEVWLAALPRPDGAEGVSIALDFFEKAVQATLVAPLKSTAAAEGDDTAEAKLSPLLSTVLATLASDASTSSEAVLPMLGFVHRVVLGLIGQSRSMALPKKVVKQLKDALAECKPAKATVKFLGECVKATEKKEVEADAGLAGRLAAAETDQARAAVVEAVGPVKANVFAALVVEGEEGREVLDVAIGAMQTELVFLHARPTDLAEVNTSKTLLALVAKRGDQLKAAQILTHRLVGLNLTEDEAGQVVSFLDLLLKSVDDDRLKRKIKNTLFGKDGELLAAFEAEDAKASPATIAGLVARLLSPALATDVALAQPFCRRVAADLVLAVTQSPTKKSIKNKDFAAAATIPVRVLGAAPLLAFFDSVATVSFLDVVLQRVAVDSLATLDGQTQALLEAALVRASALPSDELSQVWVAHFVKLHQLATSAHVGAAGKVLASGAQALLPFAAGASTTRLGGEWQARAVEWTNELLSGDSLQPDSARVLASLMYRSPEARVKFGTWLKTKAGAGVEQLDGSEAAVRALLEVSLVKGDAVVLPGSIAARFVQRTVVAAESLATEEDLIRAVQLLVAGSAEATSAVKAELDAQLTAIKDHAFTPAMLRLTSALAEAAGTEMVAALSDYVNGAFGLLVRKFAAELEDDAETLAVVRELQAVRAKYSTLALKSHLLEPLVTAVATRRLGHAEPTALAAALCAGHQFADVEATRLLNFVFASGEFHPRSIASDAAARRTQAAIVQLVCALASKSLASAVSTRVVEKMVALYGGTLSAEDASLLALFGQIEQAGGASISLALRSWNPALDDAPLESSRAAALAVAQPGYAKRAWLRAFASSRTSFPKEHAEITYDPRFLVPFLWHTLSQDDLKPGDWMRLVENGLLSLLLAALASSDDGLRQTARAALKVALAKLEKATFKEKDELVLVITHAKHCIFSPAGEPLPALSALILAHSLAFIGQTESTLYPATERFLLQRPLLDQKDVPMFYLLFFSTGDEPVEDRRWLLRFLADGLVRSQDWKVLRRRQTFELCAGLMQASQGDGPMRRLVLQFLVRATSIPAAGRELVARNGLVGWIGAQRAGDAGERRLMEQVLLNLVESVGLEKLGVVADALDALTGLVAGVTDASPAELATVSSFLAQALRRLPPATAATLAAHALVLARAEGLLRFVAARVAAAAVTDKEALGLFWEATAEYGFGLEKAGRVVGREVGVEGGLWRAAVGAAVAAGRGEVRAEVVRALAG